MAPRDAVTLVGRNWLNELRIDWASFHPQWAAYHVKQVSSVLDKYPELFTVTEALKNMAVSLSRDRSRSGVTTLQAKNSTIRYES